MYENEFDIMGLSETRHDMLDIPDHDVHVNNYVLYRDDRNRQGGGVAIYIRQSPSFTHTLRSELMPDELEIIVLEVKISNNKPILFILWYRPPGTKIEIFDHFERVLFACEQEGKEIIL